MAELTQEQIKEIYHELEGVDNKTLEAIIEYSIYSQSKGDLTTYPSPSAEILLNYERSSPNYERSILNDERSILDNEAALRRVRSMQSEYEHQLKPIIINSRKVSGLGCLSFICLPFVLLYRIISYPFRIFFTNLKEAVLKRKIKRNKSKNKKSSGFVSVPQEQSQQISLSQIYKTCDELIEKYKFQIAKTIQENPKSTNVVMGIVLILAPQLAKQHNLASMTVVAAVILYCKTNIDEIIKKGYLKKGKKQGKKKNKKSRKNKRK